jgi:hypothetical protein
VAIALDIFGREATARVINWPWTVAKLVVDPVTPCVLGGGSDPQCERHAFVQKYLLSAALVFIAYGGPIYMLLGRGGARNS